MTRKEALLIPVMIVIAVPILALNYAVLFVDFVESLRGKR
jgi:hypothetical protein